VDDDEIAAGLKEVAQSDGVLMCPEGAATYAAYKKELKAGRIDPKERTLLFNCATGHKYPMPPAGTRIDLAKPIDYKAL
jgi:threonine synthase